ncbi:AmpD protein [Marinobacter sp. DSM 26671]|uniref:1,6-anhydro-N-acetylmuramyl-L-alanine amidase AmpD n=2 Tax=Marinobacter TaxID=2742 RepID=A0A3D8GZS9_9GAMM|nr:MULTISPECIES: 1,6-anhydro-N-acetylmuramyl-L-alanine amidase AmpD [Marinobacter]MTI76352.1 1,6-anhydro-N-acetylmuramyl-L-alanine amidase AmpD [Marinobacter sp.]MBW3225003.1 1,6-anhydro-N-acetylmuramyl-L-alanine amidase AmpD [Marinobacter adhaerens]MCK5864477.1 1,6-anhydro-N-acetylmuramyl-L-alanine amidase AmpD [Marinobacter adhaerens]PPI79288.1 1,6-anhydro-N-acetylmuramyl-L-alanine amidase AmpD [Marinobacter flavimaris]RDU39925.1 1,6-anhydro-N-acetylmuramyl-L-alanine amidase AmpD [Marinobact
MPDSDVFSERPSASGTDGNSLRETGRISFARWTPSPNFGPRPDGAGISLLVVHNISLPPGQFGGREIEDFFCNQLDHSAHPYFKTIEGVQVSAHLLIRRDGALVQFVSLLDRAWHAGRSCFEGQEECNDFSIGIELEGTDDTPYTTEQYRMLAKVADLIMTAWPDITANRITGHCDIAPGRKSDPGPAFDWRYFRSALEIVRGSGRNV